MSVTSKLKEGQYSIGLVVGLFLVVALVAWTVASLALRNVDEADKNVNAGVPAVAAEEANFNGPAHELYEAALSPTPESKIHEVTISVEEKVMEVAEGKWMNLWTFGGTVPGPVVRVTEGDLVKFTLQNNGSIPHSMDFHSAEIAPNRAYRTIQPGESISFTYRAKHPGVFMYHCATAPVLHHIGNGMYGMMIVEPKDLERPPAREYAIVQSDLYFGGQGKVGDLAKMEAETPDWIVFNGFANQYLDDPLIADPGERVRLYVLNAGPSIWSAFHVIGTVFDSVWQEGIVRTGPAQTVNLAPSQGAVIEFSMEEEGIYPFVTHAFGDAVKGAIGSFMVGNPKVASGGHEEMEETPEGTLAVEAKDIAFEPSELDAEAGDVKVQVANTGVLPHDFTIDGYDKVVVAKGETKTGTFSLDAGTYTFYCSVPGHRDAGMEGTLLVQ
ncbi:MAG: multicopper oxidase domain-containing protein [Actinomycetota bacterium]